MSQELLELIVDKVNGVLGEEALVLPQETDDSENEEEIEDKEKAKNESDETDKKATARARRKKEEEKEDDDALAKLNFGKPMIILTDEQWSHDVAKLLRDDEDLQFDFLQCVTGVDYKDHMEVIYNFYSTTKKHYLYVKVRTSRENPEIISAEPLWKAADYMEREVYDLLGIKFKGHWNLKRILLPDDWEGHPLRKDYITDKKALGLD